VDEIGTTGEEGGIGEMTEAVEVDVMEVAAAPGSDRGPTAPIDGTTTARRLRPLTDTEAAATSIRTDPDKVIPTLTYPII
jgi:hypothetical protein